MIKDVEPLLKECEETLAELKRMGNMEVACYIQGFINSINKLPDAEQRPHGEWIRHVDDLFPEESTEECSVCHEEQRITGNDDNFCPNCGADMIESPSEVCRKKGEQIMEWFLQGLQGMKEGEDE